MGFTVLGGGRKPEKKTKEKRHSMIMERGSPEVGVCQTYDRSLKFYAGNKMS